MFSFFQSPPQAVVLTPLNLLIVRPSPKYSYASLYDGILINGRSILVTELMWPEFMVVSDASSGKVKCYVHKLNSGGRGTIVPDFILIRSEVRGVSEEQDFRNSLFGLMFANVPSCNSLHSIYCFLERPIVQAELHKLEATLGKDLFPVVRQSYFASHREMMYGDAFPAVCKLGHAHAGYGKMKIPDHHVLEDFRSVIALTNKYCTVEPFITGSYDLRVQKIGEHLRVFKRTSVSGAWKTNTGSSHLEEIELTDQFRIWAREASKMFGGLDICTVDAIVDESTGLPVIMEVNGTASGLSPMTCDVDDGHIRDLVVEKMQRLFGEQEIQSQALRSV